MNKDVSESENMVLLWLMTLMTAFKGFILASAEMVHEGKKDRLIEVQTEEMREMMAGYTPEERRLLVSELGFLSELAKEKS